MPQDGRSTPDLCLTPVTVTTPEPDDPPQATAAADSHDQQVQPSLPQPAPAANPTALAEALAENLMEEVFEDVDRMLDKGVTVAPAPPHAGTNGLQPLSMAHREGESDLAPLHDVSGPVTESSDAASASEAEASQPYSLGAIALRFGGIVAAAVALGLGLAVWLAQRNQTVVAEVAGSTAPAPPANSPHADFLTYVSESLETIDRRYTQQEQATGLPEPPADDVESVVEVDGDNNTPPPLDRVYIPVYQPPQGAGGIPALPTPPFGGAIAAAPAPAAPAPAPTPAAPAPPTNIPNIAGASSHTLRGTLELGDRSAAVFEYGGTSHTIWMGEQIGSSGWSLVSVSGQEAVIRRNGEVRTVYTGQSF